MRATGGRTSEERVHRKSKVGKVKVDLLNAVLGGCLGVGARGGRGINASSVPTAYCRSPSNNWEVEVEKGEDSEGRVQRETMVGSARTSAPRPLRTTAHLRLKLESMTPTHKALQDAPSVQLPPLASPVPSRGFPRQQPPCCTDHPLHCQPPQHTSHCRFITHRVLAPPLHLTCAEL